MARARTLRFQRLANRLVLAMLRVPLISRAIGKRLVTIYVRGRVTGKSFAVPVAYASCGDSLVVASPFAWFANLRGVESVEVRLAGRRRRAAVRLLVGEAEVVEHLALLAGGNHQFARFNNIGLDREGVPVPGDLQLAWAAGTRVALLTPA